MKREKGRNPSLVPKGVRNGVKKYGSKFLRGVWDGMGPDPRKGKSPTKRHLY